MTKLELANALAIAQSDRDLSGIDDTALEGLYLKSFSAPAYVTLECVAKFIRWHCFYLNGQIAGDELSEFCSVAKRKIRIV